MKAQEQQGVVCAGCDQPAIGGDVVHDVCDWPWHRACLDAEYRRQDEVERALARTDVQSRRARWFRRTR